MTKIEKYLVSLDDTIQKVMSGIDRSAAGIAVVVDERQHLLGVITDGDIRRAILGGFDLEATVSELLKSHGSPNPVIAPVDTPESELLKIMNDRRIRQIPLVDEENRVISVALMSEILREADVPIRAVVMAGGFGKRLRPLTETLPKPMLPVGDKPLLQHTIEQLRKAGIHQVNLATHYKDEVISEHFGDGKDFGVDINYVREDHPLGTAGSLSLIEDMDEPLLVVNGDILTRVDFRAMLDFHNDHKADMTVAVRKYEFRVPYGVIKTDGVEVTGLAEKPLVEQFINAGIYLIDPGVKNCIPGDKRYDMTDLIDRLMKDGKLVVCFPIREYWLDIGRIEDYEKAQNDIKNGEV